MLIFLVLLAPSLRFLWHNRDMPELGYLHDDGVQYLTAKSIAQGEGHRIQSLPESLAETKYPPLFPLYLSIVWRLNPNFPDNLRLASLFCWAAFVVLLALAWKLYRREGLSEYRIYALGAILAVNPYLILFGVTPFSEVLFTCFVLACLLASQSEKLGMAAVAGLFAGLAYLTRTAGIALLAVPAWLLWRGRRKHAALFVAALAPCILGWTLWSRASSYRGDDNTLIYYADYLRYQFINVGWDNIAVVVWKNLDQTLYSIGGLILPKLLDLSIVKIITQVVAVAAISGVVRLVRAGKMVPYALFGLLSVVILILWHFPPTERFVLPLLPLLAAGLVAELEHLFLNLRAGFKHKDRSQRIAARGVAGIAGTLVAAALGVQLFVTFSYLDRSAEQKRAKLEELKKAYSWISSNLPREARILSYDDPLMYLYTGRQGNYLPLLPRLWYADDHEQMLAAYRDLPEYCRKRGLGYVYFTGDDPGREVGEEDRVKIAAAVHSNPELTLLFQAGNGTVYKVSPPK